MYNNNESQDMRITARKTAPRICLSTNRVFHVSGFASHFGGLEVLGPCGRPSSLDALPQTSTTHLVSVDIARVKEGLLDGLVHRLVRSVLHEARGSQRSAMSKVFHR